MDREIIKLNNSQWCDLAFEDYLEVDGIEIPIEIKSRQLEGGGWHTEGYSLVFKRLSDNKYFEIIRTRIKWIGELHRF